MVTTTETSRLGEAQEAQGEAKKKEENEENQGGRDGVALAARAAQTADERELSPGGRPYHYNPRHFTKDPEYQWSDPRTQAFKKDIPAPDVHYFNPPGDQPPHLGMRGGFHKREDGWVHVNVIDPGAD